MPKYRRPSFAAALVRRCNGLADATHEWAAHCDRLNQMIADQRRRVGELETELRRNALRLDELHPAIVAKVVALFEDGHWEQAMHTAFKVVEVEVRRRAACDSTDIGVVLFANAMAGKSPKLRFSHVSDEQEAAHLLFRGAAGWYRNPVNHRFIEGLDEKKAFEALSLASSLMRMLDSVPTD